MEASEANASIVDSGMVYFLVEDLSDLQSSSSCRGISSGSYSFLLSYSFNLSTAAQIKAPTLTIVQNIIMPRAHRDARIVCSLIRSAGPSVEMPRVLTHP